MKNSLFTKNTGWNKTNYGCFIPYFFIFISKVLTQTLISLWVSTSRIFILLVQTKFMDHGIWVGIFVNFSDNQVTHHRTKCIDHYICDIGTTPAAKEVVCQKLEEFNSQAN